MDYPPGAIDGWRIEHPAGGVLVIASNPAGQAGLHTCTQNPDCRPLASAADSGQVGPADTAYPTATILPRAHDYCKRLGICCEIGLRALALSLIIAYSDLALLLN